MFRSAPHPFVVQLPSALRPSRTSGHYAAARQKLEDRDEEHGAEDGRDHGDSRYHRADLDQHAADPGPDEADDERAQKAGPDLAARDPLADGATDARDEDEEQQSDQ